MHRLNPRREDGAWLVGRLERPLRRSLEEMWENDVADFGPNNFEGVDLLRRMDLAIAVVAAALAYYEVDAVRQLTWRDDMEVRRERVEEVAERWQLWDVLTDILDGIRESAALF